jgi:hypothetical protein
MKTSAFIIFAAVGATVAVPVAQTGYGQCGGSGK